jgi:chorismate dehydratase
MTADRRALSLSPRRLRKAPQIVSTESDNPLPPLRMASPSGAEDLSRRLRREQELLDRRREEELEQSLAPMRIGSVPYLNSVPLTRGLEDQIVFAPPSQLAQLLREDRLDAALLSVTEPLCREGYDVLDGIAVASLGEVMSVFLAHRKPLEEIDVVRCDTASVASVNLLKVLLAERGLHPEFRPLEYYHDARFADYVLLIGNPALDFRREPHDHALWDLGQAWLDLTNLPFVYAVWALRRGKVDDATKRLLREARDFGLDTLDYIIASRSEYDLEFRKDYLGWHIHFHLGSDEKRGIARFVELLNRHGLGPAHEPHYVT